MKIIRGILLFIAAAACARAQFTFTIAATANATAGGYSSGQSATFVFTVTGANLSGNVNNQFFSYTNQWWDDIAADTPIFTGISGTGISGTLTRPSANGNDPFAYIQALPAGALTFDAGAETSNIGLIVNALSVREITVGNLDWGQNFSGPGYTAPTTYFTPFFGTHVLNGGGYIDLNLSAGPLVSFTATSLTISAVPEPSTYALALGAAGLAAAGWFRRRRAA